MPDARDLEPELHLVVVRVVTERARASVVVLRRPTTVTATSDPSGTVRAMTLSAVVSRSASASRLEHAVELAIVEVVDAALVEQRDRRAAAAGQHDLLADGVVEQLAAADLVAHRALEVQALRALRRRQVAAALLDRAQHRQRHDARLTRAGTAAR